MEYKGDAVITFRSCLVWLFAWTRIGPGVCVQGITDHHRAFFKRLYKNLRSFSCIASMSFPPDFRERHATCYSGGWGLCPDTQWDEDCSWAESYRNCSTFLELYGSQVTFLRLWICLFLHTSSNNFQMENMWWLFTDCFIHASCDLGCLANPMFLLSVTHLCLMCNILTNGAEIQAKMYRLAHDMLGHFKTDWVNLPMFHGKCVILSHCL